MFVIYIRLRGFISRKTFLAHLTIQMYHTCIAYTLTASEMRDAMIYMRILPSSLRRRHYLISIKLYDARGTLWLLKPVLLLWAK